MTAKIKFLARFKKIALILIISLVFLFTFSNKTYAFEDRSSNYSLQFENALKIDEMNLQSFVNETIKAVSASILRLITGSFFQISEGEFYLEKKEENKKGNLISPQRIGLLSATGMVMNGLYTNPPASGIQYFADLGNKLKIVKPALAQQDEGIGFNLMKTTQPIWQVFRNITYILFVFILVGMGFAIMFRVKISPQAVITFQSALPRIVIALILITFSYAIVGLLIDIGIFLSNLIASLFSGIFAEIMHLTWAENVADWLRRINPEQTRPLFEPFQQALMYGSLIGTSFLILVAVNPFTPVIGVIIALVIGILLLISFFKMIWTLLRAFAMITLNIVFAPFRILIGVLPGSNAITDWLKDVIANVAVFPAILAMFFLGNYFILSGIKELFTVGAKTAESFGGIFTTSFGGVISFGIINMLTAILFPLIGIMIIFMIPKISDIIQSFITKKPFDYGTAIGQAMGPATSMGRPIVSGGTEKIHEIGRNKDWWPEGTFKGGAADQVKDWVQGRMKK